MIRNNRKYLNIILPLVVTFSIFLVIQELISRSGDTNAIKLKNLILLNL